MHRDAVVLACLQQLAGASQRLVFRRKFLGPPHLCEATAFRCRSLDSSSAFPIRMNLVPAPSRRRSGGGRSRCSHVLESTVRARVSRPCSPRLTVNINNGCLSALPVFRLSRESAAALPFLARQTISRSLP